MNRARYGFTLIEMLVVIAIISILAALLLPALASSRDAARGTSCLSNMRQIGLALTQYTQDAAETLPPGYYYNNCSATPPASGYDASGINQWSGLIEPYIKSKKVFVCPSDASGGLAPTNFVGDNDGEGDGGATSAGGPQDNQAPRISYTCNEALMPRPRGGICLSTGQPQHVVKLAAVKNPSDTIELTEFSDYANAVSGTGPGGTFYKSHRPSDAWTLNADGSAATNPYDTSTALGAGAKIYTVTPAGLQQAFDYQPNATFGGGTYSHVVYVNAGRHRDGNNFLFLDGHVGWMKMETTVNPRAYKWGTHAYNQPSMPPIYDPVSGNPVQ